ncbi:MAG: hypothetical protein EH225_11570 [Calditrichaeota bacterium]|nr:hypothetical protein [Calditrichota bacterium]RQV99449.1 MAG: hypothetical protein EH225_11570 [Calditrichota bacterium]
MSLLVNLFNNRKQEPDDAHKRIRIGDQTVYLNSRGRIPVIIQQAKSRKTEIVDLVYMNDDALKLTVQSGEIFLFKRSKGEIEKMISPDGKGYQVKSIQINRNRRSLLITVKAHRASNPSMNFIHEITVN